MKLSRDKVTERKRICQNCEHFTGSRCSICGCFIALKTRLANAKCPIGKW